MGGFIIGAGIVNLVYGILAFSGLVQVPLRDALVERWFDTEEDHHETATDEQILALIEDLVGEGWHHAGKAEERISDLRGALVQARDNVVALAGAGFDSTRGEIALRALEDIDRSLGAE